MKRIVHERVDGGVSILMPASGARLATQIELADGTVLKPANGAKQQTADQFLRCWPVDGAVATWAETEDEFVVRTGKKYVPAEATNVKIIEPDAIPGDRTFRNAWAYCPKNGVRVDMQKAREIQRNALRTARAPLLVSLDTEYMRADEAGDDQKKRDVAARKQALRDATADPRIDAATTTDELKSVALA